MNVVLSDRQLISAGAKVHCLSLVLNVGLTSVAMLGLPSPSAFDSWWTTSGFCVVEEGASIPTEWLCGGVLAASAVLASLLPRYDGRLKDEKNRLLAERVGAYAFSHATHGFGHIFLWAMAQMGLPNPPLEFALRPDAAANVLMLILFWVGALRVNVSGLSAARAVLGATVVLGAQRLLGVPPELAFTYSQSIIFLAVVVDQMRRKNEYARGDGLLFFLTSLHFLPLYALYAVEMFSCSTSLLSRLGGHAVYDLYLSLVPFGLCYAVLGSAKKKVE